MTESLRSAKRRVGTNRAPIEADSEPVPVRPLPVAGLVYGASPDGQLDSPVATPGSVVEALRRQAIRRSSKAAAMVLDSDEESEHSEHSESEQSEQSDEEPDPWAGTAEEAADDIVIWLRRRAQGDTNYTVAVCNGHIYISKVNGLTVRTDLMDDLQGHIEAEGIDQSFRLYLCKKYAPSQPSNHAEMCVVAALGPANLNNITFFECISPSCDYCDTFLSHYGVQNTSPGGEPASQKGWTHPFQPIAFGTQLGDHATQVAELENYLADPANTVFRVGRRYTFRTKQGECKRWLA